MRHDFAQNNWQFMDTASDNIKRLSTYLVDGTDYTGIAKLSPVNLDCRWPLYTAYIMNSICISQQWILCGGNHSSSKFTSHWSIIRRTREAAFRLFLLQQLFGDVNSSLDTSWKPLMMRRDKEKFSWRSNGRLFTGPAIFHRHVTVIWIMARHLRISSHYLNIIIIITTTL